MKSCSEKLKIVLDAKLYFKPVYLVSIVFSLLFFSNNVQAAENNWFTRPPGAVYGSANGTSYDNAWAGLNSVVWGASGVQAGDTLWISGTWGSVGSGSQYAASLLTIGASGASGNEITIRGDASEFNPGYPDAVHNFVNRRFPSGTVWTNTGTNDVWSVSHAGDPNFIEENGVRGNYSGVTCSSPPAVSELNIFTAGDYCKDNSSQILYYKARGGGSPGSYNIVTMYGGYSIKTNSQSYITIKNLTMHYGGIQLYGSSYVTIDNVAMDYAGIRSIAVEAASHNATIKNCQIDSAGEGIYTIYTAGVSNNLLVDNCRITNIKQVYGGPDGHAIGIQGGTGHVIRNNYIDNASTAVTGYVGPSRTLEMEIYGNYAANIWRWGTGTDKNPWSGHGCAYDFHGTADSGSVKVKIHNNIARNVANAGVRAGTAVNTQLHEIYNNVIDNANIGIIASKRADVRNNIVTNPRDDGRGLPVVFRYAYSNDPYSTWTYTSDNNIYYPNAETGNKFFFCDFACGYAHPPESYSAWKSHVGNQESHSFTSDPLFTNATGNFSEATDFKLSANSPAIDAGADGGLTKDYAGNTVPQGSAPDIGAYEYEAGSPPTYSSADLNQDSAINLTDFNILKSDFLKLTASLANPRSDIDGDGQATVKDVGILMSNWR